MHRDLKSPNVLLQFPKGGDENINAIPKLLLTDFGMAQAGHFSDHGDHGAEQEIRGGRGRSEEPHQVARRQRSLSVASAASSLGSVASASGKAMKRGTKKRSRASPAADPDDCSQSESTGIRGRAGTSTGTCSEADGGEYVTVTDLRDHHDFLDHEDDLDERLERMSLLQPLIRSHPTRVHPGFHGTKVCANPEMHLQPAFVVSSPCYRSTEVKQAWVPDEKGQYPKRGVEWQGGPPLADLLVPNVPAEVRVNNERKNDLATDTVQRLLSTKTLTRRVEVPPDMRDHEPAGTSAGGCTTTTGSGKNRSVRCTKILRNRFLDDWFRDGFQDQRNAQMWLVRGQHGRPRPEYVPNAKGRARVGLDEAWFATKFQEMEMRERRRDEIRQQLREMGQHTDQMIRGARRLAEKFYEEDEADPDAERAEREARGESDSSSPLQRLPGFAAVREILRDMLIDHPDHRPNVLQLLKSTSTPCAAHPCLGGIRPAADGNNSVLYRPKIMDKLKDSDNTRLSLSTSRGVWMLLQLYVAQMRNRRCWESGYNYPEGRKGGVDPACHTSMMFANAAAANAFGTSAASRDSRQNSENNGFSPLLVPSSPPDISSSRGQQKFDFQNFQNPWWGTVASTTAGNSAGPNTAVSTPSGSLCTAHERARLASWSSSPAGSVSGRTREGATIAAHLPAGASLQNGLFFGTSQQQQQLPPSACSTPVGVWERGRSGAIPREGELKLKEAVRRQLCQLKGAAAGGVSGGVGVWGGRAGEKEEAQIPRYAPVETSNGIEAML
eukprot:g13240.t1